MQQSLAHQTVSIFAAVAAFLAVAACAKEPREEDQLISSEVAEVDENDVPREQEKARSSVAFAFMQEPKLVSPIAVDLPRPDTAVFTTWMAYTARGSADGSYLFVGAEMEGDEAEIGPMNRRAKVDLAPGDWRAQSGRIALKRIGERASIVLTDIVLTSQDGQTIGPVSGTIEGEVDLNYLCAPRPTGPGADHVSFPPLPARCSTPSLEAGARADGGKLSCNRSIDLVHGLLYTDPVLLSLRGCTSDDDCIALATSFKCSAPVLVDAAYCDMPVARSAHAAALERMREFERQQCPRVEDKLGCGVRPTCKPLRPRCVDRICSRAESDGGVL